MEFLCPLMRIRNIYLKMDTVGYHILINLLVKLIKSNFIEYRKFTLIFALSRTVILFTVFSKRNYANNGN